MNSSSHLEPDDPEELLRSGLRETTPEFEKRWSDLKRDLRKGSAPRHTFWGFRQFILFATASSVVVFALLLFIKQPRPAKPESITIPATTIAVYGELLDLNSTLSGAMPLTSTENLDALLNLSSSNRNQS